MCETDSDCNSNYGFICQAGKCACTSTSYYHTASQTCGKYLKWVTT